MNYSDVKNVKWLNSSHTWLECEVNFDHLPEEYVPFSARPKGDLPHTHEIFERAAAGEFGEIEEYVPPTLTDEVKMKEVRVYRDMNLNIYDSYRDNRVVWDRLSAEQQQLLNDWRQALLDLPATVSLDDVNIAWDEDNMRWDTNPDEFIPLKPNLS